MRPRSLTTYLACLFALLCVGVLGAVGLILYQGLEKELVLRDDKAVLNRVEQIRTLLEDSNTMQLVYEKPRLFENMMGVRDGLLILGHPGQAPLIDYNPTGMPVPNLAPVAASATLPLSAILHSADPQGTPIATVAADTRLGMAGGTLRITAGRLMSERTRILDSYRTRIIAMVACGSLLAALVAFALVRRGMRPLAGLAAQASSIGIDSLETRLDAAHAPRELAPLIASFNAMLERLSGGFTRLSQVTEDMAHDMRTPIGTLLGQTEVALGQQRSADYYHAILVSNHEELQRLSRMTDNMLFLARADQAETMIEPAWLDVSAEFARIADYFEGLAEERQLRIDCVGTGKVWGDPVLLRRALANLLANAVHYAAAPSTIVLTAEPSDEGMILGVDNAGPHIDAAQLARLFDRFYRADKARGDSSQSSGLGLAIVHSIMALHRGSAHAASNRGRNRFTLCFPPAVHS